MVKKMTFYIKSKYVLTLNRKDAKLSHVVKYTSNEDFL